jgi:lysophospholipase L1-like esterase
VGAAFSEALRSYLEANTRVRYTYNVDSEGFRRTLPQVNGEKKILVVGDSATFGVGIEDEDTIPSVLQRLVGDTHRVVNAGVPGFDADQCFRVARRLSEQRDYEILIYVAHTNDFKGENESVRSKMADKTIADFESLKSRFPGGIVVALFVPLEYAAEDVLLSEGWARGRVESLTRLRGHLADLTREASLPFVDLGDIIAEIRAREKTIFAVWSLYVDHAHLSPRGTRTLAEHTYAAMSEQGLER